MTPSGIGDSAKRPFSRSGFASAFATTIPQTHTIITAAIAVKSKLKRNLAAVIRVLRTSGRGLQSILHPRTVCRAPRLQCVRQQFDSILSPEYLAIEHKSRRTKYIGRKRVLAVLLVSRADLIGTRALEQLLAGKSGFVGQFDQCRGIGEIELIFPHSGKSAPHEWLGIETGFDGRDHDAVGQPRVQRPVRRLKMEFQSALVAPAL